MHWPRPLTESDYVERAFIAGDICVVGTLSWVFNFGPWVFILVFAAVQAALAAWNFMNRKRRA